MTHLAAIPNPIIGNPTSFVRALRSWNPAIPVCVGVALVAAALACLSMSRSPGLAEAAAVPALPDGGGKARLRSRCEGCGVVEAIRRFEPAGELPAGYEFTVRLHDGSTRVSRDANAARWHIGDRIMLIGGAKQVAQ